MKLIRDFLICDRSSMRSQIEARKVNAKAAKTTTMRPRQEQRPERQKTTKTTSDEDEDSDDSREAKESKRHNTSKIKKNAFFTKQV